MQPAPAPPPAPFGALMRQLFLPDHLERELLSVSRLVRLLLAVLAVVLALWALTVLVHDLHLLYHAYYAAPSGAQGTHAPPPARNGSLSAEMIKILVGATVAWFVPRLLWNWYVDAGPHPNIVRALGLRPDMQPVPVGGPGPRLLAASSAAASSPAHAPLPAPIPPARITQESSLRPIQQSQPSDLMPVVVPAPRAGGIGTLAGMFFRGGTSSSASSDPGVANILRLQSILDRVRPSIHHPFPLSFLVFPSL
jgi:hypothetical protein